MNSDKLIVRRLNKDAYLPVRGSEQSAGADLMSPLDYTIKPGKRQLINTDIQIIFPKGTYGKIESRSGLALRDGIIVGTGSIDADYRGNIGVLLINLGDEDFRVHRGDRIAQIICNKCIIPEVVESFELLDITNRGNKGFGSTGK